MRRHYAPAVRGLPSELFMSGSPSVWLLGLAGILNPPLHRGGGRGWEYNQFRANVEWWRGVHKGFRGNINLNKFKF